MKAVVVYESMFGNTRAIANDIAGGMRDHFDVSVVPVADATVELTQRADLLVVGGPTHMRGMASRRTRRAAKTMAEKEGSGLVLEPDAVRPGLREWFGTLELRPGVRAAAAFDTRAHGPGFITGRASRHIARLLRRRRARVISTKSFFVEKNVRLSDGEAERAGSWGASLALAVDQPLMTA
jgi:hypothetical protein